MPSLRRALVLFIAAVLLANILTVSAQIGLSDTSRGLSSQPRQDTAQATATPFELPVMLSGTVWDDRDRDGERDDSEPGLAGITIELWDADRKLLFDSIETDADGAYALPVWTSGAYRLHIVLPPGDTLAPMVTPDEDGDSAFNHTGENIGFTDPIDVTADLPEDAAWNAGVWLMCGPVPSPTPTPSPSPTPRETPTGTLTPTLTASPTLTPSMTPNCPPRATQTGTPDSGLTATPSLTATAALAASNTATATSIVTDTATPSVTLTPSQTATAGVTPPSDTPEPPANGATDTPTPTATFTLTNTRTPTATFTLTNTRTPTATFTLTNTPGGPTDTPSPTATRTPVPINLGNLVWDDVDGDGQQDPGEPGLPGVTVQLWNSTKTLLLAQTATNTSGNYTLIAPLPGTYRIRVLLPPGDSFSPKDQAGGDNTRDSDINPDGVNTSFTDVINIADNVISMTNIDAGIIVYRTPTPTRTPTPITLGNFVWDDIDGDGRQDVGEPGLPNVTVQLWNNTKTLLISQTTTNANGNYSLVAPLPGQYRIRVLLPPGDSFSPKDQAGGDNLLDSDIDTDGVNAGFTDTIDIANNVISITHIDAGIIVYRTPTPTRTPTPINLGNFVWHDLNENGVQDVGEPGIPDVTVQLWNNTKTLLLSQTSTNASGIYSLVAPLPGQYRIRVLLPADSGFSPKDVGGDDTKDSDINTIGVNLGFTDTINIANNVISMTNIDVGIIDLPQVPFINNLDLGLITPTPVPTVLRSVTPTPTRGAPPPPTSSCTGFRLTSPLDGLPNGTATFYWDPISAPGATYTISVFDESGNFLRGFGPVSGTSVSGDVSQGAIGGLFQLIVRVTAYVNEAPVCTDQRVIFRAAPPPPQPTSKPDEPETDPSGYQPPVIGGPP